MFSLSPRSCGALKTKQNKMLPWQNVGTQRILPFFGFGFSLTPKQGSCDPAPRPRAPGQPRVGFPDCRLVHTSTRISLDPRFPFSTVSSRSGRPLARQRDLGYGTPASLNPVSQMKWDRETMQAEEAQFFCSLNSVQTTHLTPSGPNTPQPPTPVPHPHSYPMLSRSDSGIAFSSPLCGLLGGISSSSP